MVVDLYRVGVDLQCEAAMVRAYWHYLFTGWMRDVSVDVTLQLTLVDELPDLPTERPFFMDDEGLPDGVGLLSVYKQRDDEVLLHYLDGALIHVPLGAERPFLYGHVLKKAADYGRLEDITFTTLAPFLRRQGYYLIHACGVSKDGEGVLIVGESGSGKTTTGLSLVLAGWELLANDVLLLEVRPDGVYALPTPGGLSMREATVALLPACQQWLAGVPWHNGKYELTNQQLWPDGMPEAVPVTAVYFCQVEERDVTVKRPLSQAVSLVRLMEQSADRWDTKMLDKHLSVLQQLSQQAACYTHHLGQNIAQLPLLLVNKA